MNLNSLCRKKTMDTIASVTKLGFRPFSLFIDKKRIKKKVIFYRKQLIFPDTKDFSDELRERVKKFEAEKAEKSSQDFLEWMKSFDHSNQYNVRIYGPFILTKRPFKFVDHFLGDVLKEMECAAIAILDHAVAKWLWTRPKYWYLKIKIWFMKYITLKSFSQISYFRLKPLFSLQAFCYLKTW